jgi:GT2 family glycosyltransferase
MIPRPAPPVSHHPAVSVVVPTYNRRGRLERVLNALFSQQTDVPFEIVVVSDGSTDGTGDYLATTESPPDADVSFRYVRQDNSGPAAARNRGVEMARGDLVVCDRLLQAHVDAHRRLGDDYVVIGPMLDPTDHRMSSWVKWEQETLQKQYSALDASEYEPSARQFYTGNASLRRSHLIAAGRIRFVI